MRWDISYKAVSFDELGGAYDVVVVGAGPAGVMAAVEAARACEHVLLVESSKLPREKSCGGMLNEYSRRALAPYGELPQEMILDPMWVDFRYYHIDRGVKVPTDVRFLNVDRALFDEWLLNLLPANVELAEGVRLSNLSQSPLRVAAELRGKHEGGSWGSKRVTAGHLIAADGPRATVRERLGLRPFGRYITVQEYVRIQPGTIEPYFDCIYSKDFDSDYGIGYIMPKGDVAIIGSVFYPGSKDCERKHEDVLKKLHTIYPLGDSVKRETWIAAHLRRPADLVAGRGRVLLAGEGGGFLSCTSGEGISFALNTGIKAGQAVAQSVQTGEQVATGELSRYQRALGPAKRNLAVRMAAFPFMNNYACKNLACYIPQPIVSAATHRL